MSQAHIDQVRQHEKYKILVERRRKFSLKLSAIILVIYFGYILLLAFMPSVLAQPVAPGMIMTIGIPAGLLVILSVIVLTTVYVARANKEFDPLIKEITEDLK